eukprot:gnl/Hemi2/13814_TR4701_c0_g1_i1.p1 gnl/Hemi2/13814_TR4701_c0_g1~~gnl/Hemi2/13814_TR4701_c0_g1_i1.p1  ORF type:complete len:530 (+),score=165.78 gnl/Hemi2/13814_TR4701_c0_g1_i1:296-1885(+)
MASRTDATSHQPPPIRSNSLPCSSSPPSVRSTSLPATPVHMIADCESDDGSQSIMLLVEDDDINNAEPGEEASLLDRSCTTSALSHSECSSVAEELRYQEDMSSQLKVGRMTCMDLHHINAQTAEVARKQGYTITMMVVGGSGLGKTTFVRNLLKRYSLPDKQEEIIIPATVSIEVTKHVVRENGTNGPHQLSVNIVDTPGYGDMINCANSWKPILKYVQQQDSAWYNHRELCGDEKLDDNRVDCVLYFIQPHRFRPLDLEFMKQFHRLVPVVPIIAKSDTMTVPERDAFKRQICAQLAEHGISVQDFGGHGPFAVASSLVAYPEYDNRLGRLYPWGFCDVENPSHTELPLLRDLIFKEHFVSIKEATRKRYRHYKRSRREAAAKKQFRATAFVLACLFLCLAALCSVSLQSSVLRSLTGSAPSSVVVTPDPLLAPSAGTADSNLAPIPFPPDVASSPPSSGPPPPSPAASPSSGDNSSGTTTSSPPHPPFFSFTGVCGLLSKYHPYFSDSPIWGLSRGVAAVQGAICA